VSASLKSKVELWVIAALAAGSLPGGLAVRQIDSDTEAPQERVIVNATVGERQLEGPEAYAVDINIELRSTTRDAAAVDSIFDAVEAAIEDADAGTGFSVLVFFFERASSDSSRGGNTRTRSRTYPAVALEA
jgi:hypothetical protein